MFCTKQTSHSQSPSGFLNLSPKPNSGVLLGNEGAVVATDKMVTSDAPGLGVVQATHFVSSALFCTIHVSHSHDPSGALNRFPNPPAPLEMGSGAGVTVLTDENAEGRVSDDLSPVPGFAVSQATHFTASGLFCTIHVSQSQVPTGLENRAPNPAEEDVVPAESMPVKGGADDLLSEGFEEDALGRALNGSDGSDEDEVEEEETDIFKVASGGDSFGVMGDVKSGFLRRSSTLPCFRVLAGLKGPSNSSLLVFVTGFTDADIAVLGMLFDIEDPNFATGALKVNPDAGEKEGGLAAVALTIGEENVNGTLGGVDATEGSFCVTLSDSLRGVSVSALGVGLGAVVAGGGTGEKKVMVGSAELLMGREMAGRSGTSGTSSSSCRFAGCRVVVRSLFILPPPEPTPLAVGVLDRG